MLKDAKAAKDAKDEGLRLAIKAAVTAKSLAASLGISQSAVSQWKQIPAERVIEVERITKVPRERLRPDLYPTAAPTQGAAA